MTHIILHNYLPKRRTRDVRKAVSLPPINKFGLLDYLTSMHHFSATAEWPDGKKTQLYLMAPSLEDAKKQYKAQTNAGGWPKITGIKQAQVKPEPR